jgi:hypothetical protein
MLNVEALHVFDFDGTLFSNPIDTPENRKKYEKATGIPWVITKDLARTLSKKLGKPINMRNGWYGRPETLEPPLVPDPAPLELLLPTAEHFKASKADNKACTVLMTGRHGGIQGQVLRILRDYKLLEIEKVQGERGKVFYKNVDKVPVHFLGTNGPLTVDLFDKPKPDKTFPWKCWIIEQYLLLHPTIQKIKIWEDREEHVAQFKEFGTQYKNLIFEVIQV